MQPDPSQTSKYMDLVVSAVDMYLRDMPEIMLNEEFHVSARDYHYWTGYSTAADPYVAPYSIWEAWYMTLFHLQPTGAQ
jgi:peptide/nickel transport system substrate-binding protein